MKTIRTLLSVVCTGALLALFGLPAAADSEETGAVLQSFVESYRTDPMALTTSFGIKVGEHWWHVTSGRSQTPYAVGKRKQYTFHEFGPHEVTLHQGPPTEPTWYFEFADRDTLNKIDSGLWTATTAAAKSTPADKTALELRPMDGFDFGQQAVAVSYQVMEHFWKRDPAEITRFSRDASLPSHGAAIVGLYTMKDKRVSWFTLGQDEAANDDPQLDRGQVPNLFIITSGRGEAIIGEQTVVLEPGMSVFVGPYVRHVLKNPNPEPLEGILILFGDNIDYVHGESYLDALEAEYAFYDASKTEEAVAAD
jgi:mannose-6-phosphate isomerase-like protein (cupin superfamily)